LVANTRSWPHYDGSDLHAFAEAVARGFGCKHIVALGCCSGHKLPAHASGFNVIGMETKKGLPIAREAVPQVAWFQHGLNAGRPLGLPQEVLQESLLVCFDGEGYMRRPGPWWHGLVQAMELAPVFLLAEPHAAGREQVGEWCGILQQQGFYIEFAGLTYGLDHNPNKQTMLAIIGNNSRKEGTPPQVRVAAILTAYNEADIILPSCRRLLEQGIDVYVLENWSSDGTYELLKQLESDPHFIGCERFPAKPTDSFEWRHMLERITDVSRNLDAEWIIHQDVDEIKLSPWPEINLKEAITQVDRMGFNAINHTVIEYFPVDNGFPQGGNHADYFHYFVYGRQDSDYMQIKTWKRSAMPVDLAESGGHQAVFEGRRVFPYKFLTKHYPYRSQAHAEKKIFVDRLARYTLEEREKGWHLHYDHLQAGHSFLRHPNEMMAFDPSYYVDHVIERLSGIGADRAKMAVIPASPQGLPAPERAARRKKTRLRKAGRRKGNKLHKRRMWHRLHKLHKRRKLSHRRRKGIRPGGYRRLFLMKRRLFRVRRKYLVAREKRVLSAGRRRAARASRSAA